MGEGSVSELKISHNLHALAKQEGTRSLSELFGLEDRKVGEGTESEVPNNQVMPGYRVVGEEELELINQEPSLYPVDNRGRFYFLHTDAYGKYDSTKLCEVLLLGGEKYNDWYDHGMQTTISWTDQAIPTYRIRYLEDTAIDPHDQPYVPPLHEIRRKANELKVDILDAFYYVKRTQHFPNQWRILNPFMKENIK